jgi:XisI protein
MDRVEQYRLIVRRLIEEYASYKPSHGQIETEAIIDREKDHYEVVHVGWDKWRRVHGSVVHVDIIGGKVWVQYDGTTLPIAEEMVAAGFLAKTSCWPFTRNGSAISLATPSDKDRGIRRL